MQRLAVVINSNARGARAIRVDSLRAALGRSGIVLQAKDLAGLDDLARTCLEVEPQILALIGGDGTLHHTLSVLARHYASAHKLMPPIAGLGGGTMNTVLRGLGFKLGHYERRLAKLVDDVRSGTPPRTFRWPSLRVGDELGFLFGLGLPVDFLTAYYAAPVRGPAGASWLMARIIASIVAGGPLARDVLRGVEARVTPSSWVPSASLQWYSAIMAGTIADVGIRIRPFTRAHGRAGMFQLIAANSRGIDYVWDLPNLYRGRPLRGAVIDELLPHAEIVLGSPAPYMLDGDIKPARSALTVEAGPAVEFARV